MRKKTRYFFVFLTTNLLLILSAFSTHTLALVQSLSTPGPKVKAPLPPIDTPGQSDGILFLGLLIFVFIAIPLLLYYRKLKTGR